MSGYPESARQWRWSKRLRFGVAAIWLVPLAIGMQLVLDGRTFEGAMVAALGLVMFVLAFRRARYGSDLVEAGPDSGDIAPPYLDYLIVAFIVVPIVLAIAFVISVIVSKASA
jgi:hypothetical protein